jgi:6-pyruvoyltetrahydropterin/6-carboxytetrahydropterin synthase
LDRALAGPTPEHTCDGRPPLGSCRPAILAGTAGPRGLQTDYTDVGTFAGLTTGVYRPYMERFHVRIWQGRLLFSAGHFITFDGDRCEPVHGHDYRVAAEIGGPLGEGHYVVDFLALRAILEQIVAEFDHRMLLPTTHPRIRLEADSRQVVAVHGDRRWVFPRTDCLLLPVANTTSELLAQHIGRELRRRLAQEKGIHPDRVRIEIAESLGQLAVWESCDNGPERPPE